MTIFRTLIIGSLGYIGLVLFLRVSGKRTLSKLNMFDFVVTVAFGSTLATVILSKEVALAQGLTGLFLLVALQFLITYAEVRSKTVKKLIRSRPTALFFEGSYYRDLMKKERVSEEELQAACRREGYGSLKEVAAIILETDGSFSVIKDDRASREILSDQGVQFPPV